MSHTRTYTVAAYMRKNTVKLNGTATIRDAIVLMAREKTNGLVVVDSNDHVIGILSSWDIISHIIPDYLEEDKHLATFESGETFENRVHAVAKDPIEKIMSTPVHTVRPEHSIMAAATLLSEFKIRQLPVVDEKGILQGYINRTDIKNIIGEILTM